MPYFAGLPCCSCQAEWLPVLQAEAIRRGYIQRTIDFYQLIGGAPQSGGTHSLGGAQDMKQGQDGFILLCRHMGSDGTWPRPFNWDGRRGIAHTHGVLRGCPHNIKTALYQIISKAFGVDYNHNGLANGAKDIAKFRPLAKRTWKAGIKWAADQVPVTKTTRKWVVSKSTTAARNYPGVGRTVASRKKGYKLTTTGIYKRKDGVVFARTRFGNWYDARDLHPVEAVTVHLRDLQYNLPAADKLPNPEARADAAVELIAKAAPTIIGFNELEPIRNTSQASVFAGQLDARLPGEWRWAKPKRAFNENYLCYRSDFLKLLDVDDIVLEHPLGGRHLTMGKFEHKASGFRFVRAVGHLVNGNEAGKEAARQAQAKDALASVRAFADGLPVIMSFDANTTALLTALVKDGMKRSREYADESNNRNASTYTGITAKRPNELAKWIIDQTYFDAVFYITGYNVVRDVDTNGDYIKPRPSDHDPVISAAKVNHTPTK